MKGLCAGLLALAAAGPAMAQGVADERAARSMLFHESRAELVARPDPAVDPRLMAVLQDRRQAAALVGSVPYYGAVAVSPDQGLVPEAIVSVGNYHSVPSAAAAALAACNAQRPSGTRPCVLAAEIRPRGWEARALQLSSGATAVFRRVYRRGNGEKALAISPSSGGYGVGKGAGAAASAMAACAAAGGAGDCRVVIAD